MKVLRKELLDRLSSSTPEIVPRTIRLWLEDYTKTIRRRPKATLLLFLTFGTALFIFSPIASVHAVEVNTGITISDGISIDSYRIAFLCWAPGGSPCPGPPASGPPTDVGVYDTVCRFTFAGCFFFNSFPLPVGTMIASTPLIYCDTLGSLGPPSGCRIVIATGDASFLTSFHIYRCDIPAGFSVSVCGPWSLITTLPIPFSQLVAMGGIAFNRDLVVWPDSTFSGFSIYRFSTNAITSVPFPFQPTYVSTNGGVIAFTGKAVGAPATTIMYYDTTDGNFRDTGLGGFGTSISQFSIAYNDNSTSPFTRIGYVDLVRNVKNNLQYGSIGPIGMLTTTGQPAIWDDRIVFSVDEPNICLTLPCSAPVGFDCDGVGGPNPGEPCLQYWNLRNVGPRSYIAPLMAPSATEPMHGPTAIYDKLVAFRDRAGSLRYLYPVPMKGDVNEDGHVDIIDIANAAICFGTHISNSTSNPFNC